MRFELHAKGIALSDRLRRFIEKKLQSTLGRFSHLVQRVRVRLTDENGPKGGEDIQCQIRTSLGRAGVVTINETRSDPFAAVARASDRASHRLSRHWARVHARQRGR